VGTCYFPNEPKCFYMPSSLLTIVRLRCARYEIWTGLNTRICPSWVWVTTFSARKCGIGVNLHYIPVYKQPYYEAIGYNIENYLNSEQYYRRAISLPIYPTLTTGDQDYVIEELSRCIKALE
jgi:hypothetical protein